MAMETLVILIIVLVVLVSVVLYFTGSTAVLFGEVGTISEATTEPTDVIAEEYSDSLGDDYFQGDASDFFG